MSGLGRILPSSVPQLPFQLSRLLYRETTLDGETGEIVIEYLRSVAAKIHDWGDQFLVRRQLDDGNVPQVGAWQAPCDGTLFAYRGRWPVLVRWRTNPSAPNNWTLHVAPFGPSGRDIVRDALSWHQIRPRAGFAIYRAEIDEHSFSNSIKLDRSVPPDRSSWYVIPEEAEEVRRTVRFWLDGRRWFQERGMPWRLGIELEGPPGTGKSTLVKALAQELAAPLVVVSPEVLERTTDWSQLWSAAVSRVRPPLFVLVEDFDLALRPHLLEGLEDIKEPSSRRRNSRSTLSGIMNLLDGVSTPDGVCFFVTTNNPQDVEQAAVRPGRIDRVVHVGVASERVRQELARRVLLGFPTEELEAQVAAGAGETAAAFRLRCQKLALAKEMG